MIYYQIKKQKMLIRKIVTLVVLPALGVFIILPLLFFPSGAYGQCFAFCWMLLSSLAFVLTAVKAHQIPYKLKQLCLSVGAVIDEQMDELLESAVNFDNTYFISDQFVIDFVNDLAYPIKELENVECCEYLPRVNSGFHRKVYAVKLKCEDGKKQFLEFKTANKRDAVFQLIGNHRAAMTESDKGGNDGGF